MIVILFGSASDRGNCNEPRAPENKSSDERYTRVDASKVKKTPLPYLHMAVKLNRKTNKRKQKEGWD
jgi:hypothetical protein